MEEVSVGSIVYLCDKGSKLRARPRYVVLSIKEGWCSLRRFADKQLGRTTYSVKLSECYLASDETKLSDLPPYPEYDVSDENDFQYYKPSPTRQNIPLSSNGESSSSEDELDNSDNEGNSSDDAYDEISYCAVCRQQVKEDHHGLICDTCTKWSHRYCVKMTKKHYQELTKSNEFTWVCPSCPPEDEQVVAEREPPDNDTA